MTVSAPALPVTCSKPGEGALARLEPLSPTRLRVEFTARAELYQKLEKARELLSHALPSGDLGELVERAVDVLIEQETRKRFGPRTASGAGNARKARELKPGSRHVPVETERAVWERDNSQCTFVDGEGQVRFPSFIALTAALRLLDAPTAFRLLGTAVRARARGVEISQVPGQPLLACRVL